MLAGRTPLYGTSIARTPSGNAFLLDRRCQDVRYVTDTDSDGWPDSLLPVPFAMSGSYPSLLSMRWVGSIGEDIFKASLTDPYLSGGAARGRTFDTYEDQDGDHVCDVHTAPGAPALAFGTIGMPYDGQTILPVRVLHGNGETVQVWGLDPAGDTLLGSGTVSGHEVAVAVATPLSEGGKVGIKLLADAAYRLEAPVIPAWPQITDVSPACVTENVAATIEIEGVNFDPNDTVRYHTIYGVAHAAQFTYISTTRLDVSIPALAGAQAGPVGITIYGSDQDPEVDTIPAVFQLQFVCAPE